MNEDITFSPGAPLHGFGAKVYFKGGGSGNSEKLQKASMKQSQDQFDAQMALQREQMKKGLPPPVKPEPISPAPQKSSAEVLAASDAAMREAKKRRGLVASMQAGNTGGYGSSAKMGGNSSLLG